MEFERTAFRSCKASSNWFRNQASCRSRPSGEQTRNATGLPGSYIPVAILRRPSEAKSSATEPAGACGTSRIASRNTQGWPDRMERMRSRPKIRRTGRSRTFRNSDNRPGLQNEESWQMGNQAIYHPRRPHSPSRSPPQFRSRSLPTCVRSPRGKLKRRNHLREVGEAATPREEPSPAKRRLRMSEARTTWKKAITFSSAETFVSKQQVRRAPPHPHFCPSCTPYSNSQCFVVRESIAVSHGRRLARFRPFCYNPRRSHEKRLDIGLQ